MCSVLKIRGFCIIIMIELLLRLIRQRGHSARLYSLLARPGFAVLTISPSASSILLPSVAVWRVSYAIRDGARGLPTYQMLKFSP
jgi:hypothetical protein